MNFESSKKERATPAEISDALGEITGIEHETYPLGGNEVERENFEALRQKVATGKLSPQEGKAEAVKMRDDKNSNYH